MGHASATDDLGTPPAVADITTLLHALGDPVRLELVRALAVAEEPISCGAFEVAVTKSTLSYHFRILRDAGVIDQTCAGVRKLTTLRRRELDAAYPGLLDSVLRAAVSTSGRS
jgi:DNA-binding transcriptional ArsR family regulator